MTTGDYAQFASGVIYLCPHCMGKRTDGSHDWHMLLNRSVSWSFSWVTQTHLHTPYTTNTLMYYKLTV